MTIGLGSYALALVAGALSVLSPCVLPLLPVVLATAAAAHRFGPYALAAGMTLSFTLIGVLIASLGVSLGIDQTIVQQLAAAMLIAMGVLLLSSTLQARFATVMSSISNAGQTLASRISLDGLAGQFVLGSLLGVVWSPCVGPTLGTAITLASQGKSLVQVMLLMLIFGLGASMPMVFIGSLSRQLVGKLRGRLSSAGTIGKQVLGVVVLLLGVSILSGGDKWLETWAVQASPDWLIRLTTSL
ncbi:MAG TPA: cytochrome c biogenesis CcdA family protein [Rhodocyclaceae bacterium]|nr:cytochrome c biogenesis CcdA family protein [Rhodocyclaceae bacterium]